MKDKNVSKRRNFKSKKLAPANYLIVCEGTATKPNYFNGLKKKINEKIKQEDNWVITGCNIVIIYTNDFCKSGFRC